MVLLRVLRLKGKVLTHREVQLRPKAVEMARTGSL
jgi:hypothetical protein